MNEYSIRDVQRTLGLSRSMILGLVKSGYVTPRLGARHAYRFTFRDLVVMRTAQELLAAKIPARLVAHTLQRLRAQLPAEASLGGLRIRAAGDRIVVQDGTRQWDANTGQYVLDFSATAPAGTVRGLASAPAPRPRPRDGSSGAASWKTATRRGQCQPIDARSSATLHSRARI